MNLAELEKLHAESLEAVNAAADAAALEQARIKYLGRNGILPALTKQIKDVPPEERAAFGKAVNAWRQALDAAMSDRAASFASSASAESFSPSAQCRSPTRISPMESG